MIDFATSKPHINIPKMILNELLQYERECLPVYSLKGGCNKKRKAHHSYYFSHPSLQMKSWYNAV